MSVTICKISRYVQRHSLKSIGFDALKMVDLSPIAPIHNNADLVVNERR